MKLLHTVLACMLIVTNLSAQTTHRISGIVKQASSGETLIGVTVSIAERPGLGVVSNEYGFYSLALPSGHYTLRFSYVGYKQQVIPISLDSSKTINIALAEENSLREVVISSKKNDDNLNKATMGTEELSIKETSKLPVIFGEKDLVKTIQLLPGVKTTGEGGNGFSVRGGATDQNLILLDEAPVYNASHLLGFFSSFNSDAIKDVTLIKGNSPAQYGGRLSSVLDVKMREGNNKDYQLSGGLGLISSRLTVEGPIQREHSSFIISARRTYADLIARQSSDLKDLKLYFYDLNAKANWALNDKNKLYLSGYFGKDVFGLSTLFGSEWGNSTATLRWNSVLNNKLFSNTSFIYSNYDFNVGFQTNTSETNYNSHIRDLNLKQDFNWFLNNQNTLRFGFNVIQHKITPNNAQGTGIAKSPSSNKGLESALYIGNSWRASGKLSIDYGVRISGYSIIGAGTYNIYDNHSIRDSVKLSRGSLGKTYINVEPRFSINYRLNSTEALKIAYARNSQHLHMMSNSTGGSPTDSWIGNSYNVQPEISDQYSLGFSKNLMNNSFELNTEAYFKTMKHQIDYRDGADINTSPDVESELLYGKGRAYGIEILLKKKTGRLTGWLGYTLSKTERQISGINEGQWYNAKQDRRHDLSLVAVYSLTSRWTMSGTFVYATGNAVTFPTGKYYVNDMVIYQYGARNADRMPANHRLDLSATYERPSKGRWQSSWSFGLYNVYGRRNPFSITFEENKDNPQKIDAVKTSLFQWVPSVTYNFKF